jgi:hypothetical protein
MKTLHVIAEEDLGDRGMFLASAAAPAILVDETGSTENSVCGACGKVLIQGSRPIARDIVIRCSCGALNEAGP